MSWHDAMEQTLSLSLANGGESIVLEEVQHKGPPAPTNLNPTFTYDNDHHGSYSSPTDPTDVSIHIGYSSHGKSINGSQSSGNINNNNHKNVSSNGSSVPNTVTLNFGKCDSPSLTTKLTSGDTVHENRLSSVSSRVALFGNVNPDVYLEQQLPVREQPIYQVQNNLSLRSVKVRLQPFLSCMLLHLVSSPEYKSLRLTVF